MPSIDKWKNKTTRGEDKAITTINRYRQKTISLPRFTEDKRLWGYPGLAGTAKQLASLVPKCNYYIEPFAGTVKVFQELSKDRYETAILNDKSEFIYNWLMQEFSKDAYIFNVDFIPMMSRFKGVESAFQLIDAPWNRSFYDQGYSCFNRKNIKDYDNEILEQLSGFRGEFIICTKKDNKRMLDSDYDNYLVEGDYLVFGKTPKTLVTTNMKLPKGLNNVTRIE
ncbi:DNA adenine methylase [Nitrosopumilus sp.]|uniref:DNA adenine methylase n=1 Tax=Nitrosopumilus sp. TaxID=2024843 RepID=UPI003D12B7BC